MGKKINDKKIDTDKEIDIKIISKFMIQIILDFKIKKKTTKNLILKI